MKNKRILIALLLAIMTINGLSLQEVFRIPVLFAHYFEHKERMESLTVIEYLSMHYWQADMDDGDNDRDKQLPFKSVNTDQSIHSMFVQADAELISTRIAPLISYLILESQLQSSRHLGSLFKPPRLA